MRKINIHTDGGSRRNPGPAAIGICISTSDGEEIIKIKRMIGFSTNNVAEYTAVLTALEWIKNNFQVHQFLNCEFVFYIDSLLVVNQLNGVFKIKDSNLREIIIKIKEIQKSIGGKISYVHISREANKVADALVNDALDKN